MATATIIIIFFLLLILGIPIAFVLGLTSLSHIVVSGNTSMLTSFAQSMLTAANNFSLMAIPLFVLTGELMNYGGITKRLTDFARTFVSHFKGGLAYVNILVSMFLSAIVGSANAVAAIQSSSMVPEMEKDGYRKDYSSAVTASSSIMGPIIPPSMVFILYGVTASTSIGSLFLAGIIPGLLLALSFSVISFFYARKHDFPTKSRAGWKERFQSLLKAAPALVIPLFIIGGIVSGFFTATEAGAIGSLVAFIVGMFFYRDLKWKNLYRIFLKTGIVTASIMIIVATANLFGLSLTFERIPQMIAEGLLSISTNPWVVLLILNVVLLTVGMFLEPLAAIIIVVPVLMPVISQLGIDPVHFGVMVSLNLVIGLITPPVGVALFVTAGITKVSISTLSRAVTPFVIAAVIILLIITYIPDIVLFVPELFSL
ncbi:TRAP transporter large permease [Alteribacillus sp. YIM 98480]|uniref:TRAP transporter large permease n=1 Tax=Alteribacillus sp. YIM 98480 TaxID=2606599 RepID=UPI00131EBA76|nr:TRAP transporter large permease [Alteribacillus sp. YIM 98480]